ncbi:hypothetical protein G4F23_002958 [Salmonella enterica]|nr:hypothetical protein [Salmonella enterica]EEH8325672.1 hypothetical protein [Salmonella enterica]
MKAVFNVLEMIMKVTCPDCCGDGKETCHNPDHGFIEAMSFHDLGRIGCPCCGHDAKRKVPNGGKCETCNGSGSVDEKCAKQFCDDFGYDYERVMKYLKDAS